MSERVIVVGATLALLLGAAGCGNAITKLGGDTTTLPCGIEADGSSSTGPCVWTPAQAAAAAEQVVRGLRGGGPQGNAKEKSQAQSSKEKEASSGMSYQETCKLFRDCSAEEQ